ncbi:NADPH oxidase 5-like [Xenia sp. Carnegie-2017]|uniref:NADPH oxidase 5-like n=1 Tax=Xenia sp. Carnegie-2017 TaxID=2897299 RepID=UPI001F035B99|nr:NADPH oxidase 5-like [Xenia sp. Carnegie-2017]XP_046846022.1 NADPH oxidase 5-like [Xenia sp. Carnegie-2017]
MENNLAVSTVAIPMDSYDRRPSAWFRESFGLLGKYGKISKEQFVRASCDIGDLSSKLYGMFDPKNVGYVQVQEVVGSFRLLYLRSKTGNGKANTKSFIWLRNSVEYLADSNGNIPSEKLKEEMTKAKFMENFFKLLDVNNEGEISLSQIVAAIDRIECSSTDSKWYEWIEEKFSVDSNESRLITLKQFKKGLHIEKSFFAERFFHLFKTDLVEEADSISMKDLCQGLEMLTNGSQIEKLKFLFKVYDIDGNGKLDRNEMKTVLESCVEESSLSMDQQQVEDLTDVLFEESDKEGKGFITFDELQSFLDKFPGIAENLTISAGKWLTPPQKSKKKTVSSYIPKYFTWNYISNNPERVGFITFYLLINAALMVWVGIERAPMGVFVVLARIHGMCLNLNCTFIFVLMLKMSLTWLRSTSLRKILPIDDHIMFHKLVGLFIIYLSFGHTLGHVGFYIDTPGMKDNNATLAVWEYLFTTRGKQGWFENLAGITGVILILILVIMGIFSLPFVRRSGHFEIFYWTHHLFIAFWILIILHAPNFWKWIIVPGILYIVERIIRLRWFNLARYGRTFIEEGITLPSKVTHLVITRPPNFNFKPGDYVHINIPEIASNEWHPFTISSSPEQEDVLWVHVRGVGTWTKKLYDYYEKEIDNEEQNEGKKRSTIRRERTHRAKDRDRYKEDIGEDNDGVVSENNDNNEIKESENTMTVRRRKSPSQNRKKLRIYVDGPYGAPSVHIFEAEHAVLIAGGIGVTPFASILQSIMKKVQSATNDCPLCHHKWVGAMPQGLQKLRKVDFYWINRCQRSFEWFLSLMNEIEVQQCCQGLKKNFIDMHIHMTSALKKDDMKGLGLQLALDLIHEKNSVDMITGLRTKTSPGRPNWDKEFERLYNEKQGKVTVFFCGAPVMGKVIKVYCRKYGFGFRKENF